jgi:alanine-synthesizing transaminase
VDGLAEIDWKMERPRGTMFVWAPIPGPYDDMSSAQFSIHLLEKAGVAISPGVGFGPSGEGFVRFALVEETSRIEEAVARIGQALDRL